MDNIIRRHVPINSKRCAFTGYRPQKMPWGFDESDPRCIEFKARLKNTILMLIDQGYTHFLSGGAMGMDIFAAEIVCSLRTDNPNLYLEMVSPFDGQTAKWSDEYRARHDTLFEQADVVTATGHAYTKSCMFMRNRYLVDNADLLLAAFDGQAGGTAMTIDYAKRNRVPVVCIQPLVRSQSTVQYDCRMDAKSPQQGYIGGTV